MVRIINDTIAVVENVDIFTPIHDDPFIQGEIVACNATNDIFAMGAVKLLSLQAFLAIPDDIPEEIPVGVLKGMDAFMKKLGSTLAGGQTIKNNAPVFGGIALGIAEPKDIVYSTGAKPGDTILLTKPLGVQPAMRSYRDLQDEKRDALLAEFDESDLKQMQDNAVRIMTQSNLEVAEAMKAVGVHAATDITGFGLLGHAGNVSELSNVDVIIDRIPVIKGTLELARFFGHKLSTGFGAETAGGMLVFLPPEKVEQFSEYLKKKGLPCWPVGTAVKPDGSPCACLAQNVEYIETTFP